MKRILLLTFVLSTALPAFEPPTNYTSSRYSHLWRNSIITDKPKKEDEVEVPNDIDDWVLIGTTKGVNGQTITILNTKDQNKRFTVPSPEAAQEGFSLISLKQDPSSFLNTEARVRKGSFEGTVKYEQKFLTLKKAAPTRNAKKPANTRANPKPNANNRATPPLPGQAKTSGNSTNKRPPRVRYVPRPKKK